MTFKLGMTVDLCKAYYARVNDLDLDGRSKWLGRGKNAALNYLDYYKQAIT